jgi:hypothetical protein
MVTGSWSKSTGALQEDPRLVLSLEQFARLSGLSVAQLKFAQEQAARTRTLKRWPRETTWPARSKLRETWPPLECRRSLRSTGARRQSPIPAAALSSKRSASRM